MSITYFKEIFDLRYLITYYSIAIIVIFCAIEFVIKKRETKNFQLIILSILSVALIFLFGLRTENVGTDTLNNIRYFIDRRNIFSLTDVKDIGLYSTSLLIRQFTSNIDVFLSFLALIFILPMYLGVLNLRLKNPLIFFFFLFSLFIFKSMGINIQKQGIALAFFFWGMTYYLKDKRIYTYVLFLIAFFFHASILIAIFSFLVSTKFKNIKYPLFIYVAATILSLINFNFYALLENIPIINILVRERLEGYTMISDTRYQTGFRYDFWIFNTAFLCLGYMTYNKFENYLKHTPYKLFFTSYMLLSSFFFLMFSYGFSDRFGIMSWIFIPFLLWPYANLNNYKGFLNTLSMVLFSVLISTIFSYGL